MEAPVTLSVRHHAVTFFIILPAVFHVISGVLRKIVLIDKIIAGVVGWVDIDHLDPAQISFLQKLQHFQVVTLDVEVFAVKTAGRAVPADAVRHYRAQRGRDGRIRRQHRFFLVRPRKLVTFFPAFHDRVRKLLPQHVKINGVFHLAVSHHFCNGIREQLADPLYISFHAVKAVHFQLVHYCFPLRFLLGFDPFCIGIILPIP